MFSILRPSALIFGGADFGFAAFAAAAAAFFAAASAAFDAAFFAFSAANPTLTIAGTGDDDVDVIGEETVEFVDDVSGDNDGGDTDDDDDGRARDVASDFELMAIDGGGTSEIVSIGLVSNIVMSILSGSMALCFASSSLSLIA